MEDEYFVSPSGDFAAVFDGHGGPSVSLYLRKNLHPYVQAILLGVVTPCDELAMTNTTVDVEKTLSEEETSCPVTTVGSIPTCTDFTAALESALEKIDRELEPMSDLSEQGSTAVVVWIHEDKLQQTPGSQMEGIRNPTTTSSKGIHGRRALVVANIGDSRAVLCRDGIALELTRDHKPNDPIEKTRIEQLGGEVMWCGEIHPMIGQPVELCGYYRVNGNLAVARAVGDVADRPYITAEPDMMTFPIEEEKDEFIILASDGLWDVVTSHEAIDFVQRHIQQGFPRDEVATRMVEESLRRRTIDNVTIVIIWLDLIETSNSSTL